MPFLVIYVVYRTETLQTKATCSLPLSCIASFPLIPLQPVDHHNWFSSRESLLRWMVNVDFFHLNRDRSLLPSDQSYFKVHSTAMFLFVTCRGAISIWSYHLLKKYTQRKTSPVKSTNYSNSRLLIKGNKTNIFNLSDSLLASRFPWSALPRSGRVYWIASCSPRRWGPEATYTSTAAQLGTLQLVDVDWVSVSCPLPPSPQVPRPSFQWPPAGQEVV